MPVDQSPTCVAPQYVLSYIRGKETARTNNERSFMALVNYNNIYNPYSRAIYNGSAMSAGSCGSLSSAGGIGSCGYAGSCGGNGSLSYAYGSTSSVNRGSSSGINRGITYTGSAGNTGRTGSTSYAGSARNTGSTSCAGSTGSVGYIGSSYVGSAGSMAFGGSVGSIGSAGYVASPFSSLSTNMKKVANSMSGNNIEDRTITLMLQTMQNFVSGKIPLKNAVQILKNYGIKDIQITDSNTKSIKFTLGEKSYTFSCSSEYKSGSPTKEFYSKSDLQGKGTCYFSDKMLNEYFDISYKDSDGTVLYTLKPDCGYTSADKLGRALFNQYSQDLLLDNFLNNKNREVESGSLLSRETADGTIITTQNYTQYIDEIGLAEGEDAKKLRDEALNKLLDDFTLGNLTTSQASAILTAIGVTDKKFDETQEGLYEYTFKYDGVSYTIRCNKAAAESSTDAPLPNYMTNLDSSLITPRPIGEVVKPGAASEGLTFGLGKPVQMGGTSSIPPLNTDTDYTTEAVVSEVKDDTTEVEANWNEFLENGDYDKLLNFLNGSNEIEPEEMLDLYNSISEVLDAEFTTSDADRNLKNTLEGAKDILMHSMYKNITGKVWDGDKYSFARDIFYAAVLGSKNKTAIQMMRDMDDVFYMSESQKECLNNFLENPDTTNITDMVFLRQMDTILRTLSTPEATTMELSSLGSTYAQLYDSFQAKYGIDSEIFGELYTLAGEYALNSGTVPGTFENSQEFLHALESYITGDIKELSAMLDKLNSQNSMELEENSSINTIASLLESEIVNLKYSNSELRTELLIQMTKSDLNFTLENFLNIYNDILGEDGDNYEDYCIGCTLYYDLLKTLANSSVQEEIEELTKDLVNYKFKDIIEYSEPVTNTTNQPITCNVNKRICFNDERTYNPTGVSTEQLQEWSRQNQGELWEGDAKTPHLTLTTEQRERNARDFQAAAKAIEPWAKNTAYIPFVGDILTNWVNRNQAAADYSSGKISRQEYISKVSTEDYAYLAKCLTSVYALGAAMGLKLMKWFKIDTPDVVGYLIKTLSKMGVDKNLLLNLYLQSEQKIFQIGKRLFELCRDNASNVVIENYIREQVGSEQTEQGHKDTQGAGTGTNGASGAGGGGSSPSNNNNPSFSDIALAKLDSWTQQESRSGNWLYYNDSEGNKNVIMPIVTITAHMPWYRKEFFNQLADAGLSYEEAQMYMDTLKKYIEDDNDVNEVMKAVACGKYKITKEEEYAGSNTYILGIAPVTDGDIIAEGSAYADQVDANASKDENGNPTGNYAGWDKIQEDLANQFLRDPNDPTAKGKTADEIFQDVCELNGTNSQGRVCIVANDADYINNSAPVASSSNNKVYIKDKYYKYNGFDKVTVTITYSNGAKRDVDITSELTSRIYWEGLRNDTDVSWYEIQSILKQYVNCQNKREGNLATFYH